MTWDDDEDEDPLAMRCEKSFCHSLAVAHNEDGTALCEYHMAEWAMDLVMGIGGEEDEADQGFLATG